MPLTIARIAELALNAAQGAISGAVQAATITRAVPGPYIVADGAYVPYDEEATGRAVFETMTPGNLAIFPTYTAGPNDQLLFLEGFTSVLVNDKIVIAGVTRTIKAVQDIVGAGTVYRAIAA